CGKHGRCERQTLYALRCPFSTNLAARDSPDLFRVGLEEELVQSASESIAHPLLERILHGIRVQSGVDVTRHDSYRIHDAESAEGIACLQRIVEVLAAVVDSRQSRDIDELIAEQLFPELLDGSDLGEETMATDVEPVSLVLRSLGDPAYRVTGFEHGYGHTALGEQVRRRKACWASAADEHAVARPQTVHTARAGHSLVSFDQFHGRCGGQCAGPASVHIAVRCAARRCPWQRYPAPTVPPDSFLPTVGESSVSACHTILIICLHNDKHMYGRRGRNRTAALVPHSAMRRYKLDAGGLGRNYTHLETCDVANSVAIERDALAR